MLGRNVEKRYPTDVDDATWLLIEPILRKKPGKGRKRTVNIRLVVNAIFYLNRTGCQWEMLPKEFPDYRHVNYYYWKWIREGTWDEMNAVLRSITRNIASHDDEPSAAILDSQSTKTTTRGEERGFDAGKQVKGRKRFLVVDTLGLLLVVMVMSASRSESSGGGDILEEVEQKFGSIKKVWADSAYGGRLVEYTQKWYRFVLEIIRPAPDQHGFKVHPKRWIVERTLSWLNWSRRLSKEYEMHTDSSEAMIKIAMIRMMLKRIESALSVM